MKWCITGGAGSLGKVLASRLARADHTVRVLDINEADLASMRHRNIRTIYGSVTDPESVELAIQGVDCIVHAAALKNLDISEYNIKELVRTNIMGSLNVAVAAMTACVPTCILVSTDKAVYPTTAYGVTKLMAEKIWLWAHRIAPATRFLVLRSGNFTTARGNVFEVWKAQERRGEPLTVTDLNMQRYYIETETVAEILEEMGDPLSRNRPGGGSIVIPKMDSYLIQDLLHKHYPHSQYRIIGRRPGEKMCEQLWTSDEHVVAECALWRVVQ